MYRRNEWQTAGGRREYDCCLSLPLDVAGCVIIEAANANRRLDVYLRQLYPQVPLGTLMKWIRTGRVRVNGKRVAANTRLAVGDTITTPPVEPAAEVKKTPRKRLPPPEILYEDDDLMIVRKPGFLACHAGTGHEDDSLAARIVHYLKAHDAPPGKRPGLAQRLDGGVSGILPVGKHAPALRTLAQAVESGNIDKTYAALVDGRVAKDAGTIDIPLRIDDQPMGNQPRTFPDPNGKPAISHYTVVERLPNATLVHVRIETGRTHQIRAHLKAIGHGILGDPRYGPAARNEQLLQTYGLRRPFLHAFQLVLQHPVSGEQLTFCDELPDDLERVLVALRRPKK